MEWKDVLKTINQLGKKGYEVDIIGNQLLLIKKGVEILEFNSEDELLTFIYDEEAYRELLSDND